MKKTGNLKNSRPKIKVPYQFFDIILECVSITLILLLWLYLFSEYSSLPDTIASHYNSAGEPNDYSNKTFIWILPSIATLLYVGLFILNRFPHLHNYMVNITEENALKNYRFSTRIVRITYTLCAALIAYITYHIIEGAKGEVLKLGSWFLPIVLGASILLPVIIFIFYRKINKL